MRTTVKGAAFRTFEFALFARLALTPALPCLGARTVGARIGQHFGSRKLCAVEARKGNRDILGGTRTQQQFRHGGVFVARLLREQRILEQSFVVELADVISRRDIAPDRRDAGGRQYLFGFAAARGRDEQNADPFASGTTGAARAILQDLRVVGQIGMDDEAEIRQIDAARSDVGCNADAGAAIAQSLQCVIAFGLAEFARKRDDGTAAFPKDGVEWT